jgi:hypothetical protein
MPEIRVTVDRQHVNALGNSPRDGGHGAADRSFLERLTRALRTRSRRASSMSPTRQRGRTAVRPRPPAFLGSGGPGPVRAAPGEIHSLALRAHASGGGGGATAFRRRRVSDACASRALGALTAPN